MVGRVCLGAFPDGGYGLRISDPGYAVRSNPVDDEHLAFNSDWPAVLPVHVMGTASVNGALDVWYPAIGYMPFSAALINVGGRGWEQYATTNSMFRRWGSSMSSGMNLDAKNQFAFEGSVFTNVQMIAYSDHVHFYTSAQVWIAYFIYRMRAF